MNRRDFQILSNMRLSDARALLESQRFSGAYYILGYAVECGLKASIAKGTKRFDFPDRKTVTESYTHDLQRLLNVSGLQDEFRREIQTNPQLALNWAIVTERSEETRYRNDVSEAKARELFLAVTARKGGVLTWLKKFW